MRRPKSSGCGIEGRVGRPRTHTHTRIRNTKSRTKPLSHSSNQTLTGELNARCFTPQIAKPRAFVSTHRHIIYIMAALGTPPRLPRLPARTHARYNAETKVFAAIPFARSARLLTCPSRMRPAENQAQRAQWNTGTYLCMYRM